MAIDATMRGVLEQYIDSIVIAIPNIVKVFFDPSNKALQIHDENDFAFGVALGNIQNAFLTTFVSMHELTLEKKLKRARSYSKMEVKT
jgi:hypothetical protein